jgi:hypothetical protein
MRRFLQEARSMASPSDIGRVERAAAAWLEEDARPKPPAPKKRPLASVEHHKKERRAEERSLEETSAATLEVCVLRTVTDHSGRCACEACHHFLGRELEPHHLILGTRTDAPELVMLLCADCHRLGPGSAHRSPRHFAQHIVIPWAKAHGYPIPNRKEYR